MIGGAPLPLADQEWYRRLYGCRACETRIQQEYPGDAIKTPVHLSVGAEAIAVGVIGAAPEASPVFATYRNHAAYLARTDDVEGFFAELYGRGTGRCKGKAGSMHLSYPAAGLILSSAIVGSTIPVAVGLALARRRHALTEPVLVFFGDGAVEEGVFWESLNFACLQALPVLFVCEDNDLAIHSTGRERKGFASIADTVATFRCPVVSGEGRDVREVARLASGLLDRLRVAPSPGFLICTYHRYLEHVGIREDYGAGYRLPPDPVTARDWDPLLVSEAQCLQSGSSPQTLEAIRAVVDARIDRAVAAARCAPDPAPETLYADMPG